MPAEAFTQGTYFLFNGQFGTALELDPSTRTSVHAGNFHGRPCQQWEFAPVGVGYLIRCALAAKDGSPVYLSFRGGLRNGEHLKADPHPMLWHVAQYDDMIRLMFSNKYCADLDVHGKQKVQMMCVKHDQRCQLWYPSRSDLASVIAADQRASKKPLGGDTVEEGAKAHADAQGTGGVVAPPGPGPHAQVLVNVGSGAALSLCRMDDRSLKCNPLMPQEPNQQWTFIPNGNGCAVQSGMRTADGEPLYLTIEGAAAAGAAVVATPYPVSWDVRRCDADQTRTSTYRVFWPGTRLLIAMVEGDVDTVQLAQFANRKHEIWRTANIEPV